MDSGHGDTRMVDLEVEEAEDVAGDPSIGPDSPTLLRASSKSQTKTWVVAVSRNWKFLLILLDKCPQWRHFSIGLTWADHVPYFDCEQSNRLSNWFSKRWAMWCSLLHKRPYNSTSMTNIFLICRTSLPLASPRLVFINLKLSTFPLLSSWLASAT